MHALHRRTLLAGALALTVAASAAACGDSEEKSANGLEQSEITVGTMLVGDTAPLQLAISRGLFKAEGLTVKTQVINGGAEAIPRLKSGQLDISFGNYVSFFNAAATGALKVKVVAEASQTAPKTHTLLVAKDSPIRSIADLKGKKIGVNTKRNVGTLLVRSAAKPAGVELDEDKNFVEVPPPNMEAALKSGSVDAVQAIEPFGTQIQQKLGARLLADLSSGATADFPLAGYATTEEFANKNPKTVAAFQRAIVKAQGMAADRKVVQDILPKYARGIDANVAATMVYTAYPTSLNATRLQRVADVMQQFGIASQRIDVKPLLISGATSG
ncbi:ABC transporter substrate-binding protein [Actinomadura keratinilytica]|jgi:NitT/TauT family transport system substrate-binding protein|uniref:ABC transporter substrate-binding protein n=1 Tax=Actinomadura keratinilytica TaxID=547461 RepID=A0ABP7Z0I2_9ACTN